MHVIICAPCKPCMIHTRVLKAMNKEHLTRPLLQHHKTTAHAHRRACSSLLTLYPLWAACSLISFSGAALPWQVSHLHQSRAA